VAVPHRRFDVAAEGRAGHTLRIGPDQRVGRTVERTVTGEAELTAAGALCPLIDNAADGFWISAVAQSVQHHLRHGALAFLNLVAGFKIDRLAQAMQGAGAVFHRGLQHKPRRGLGHIGNRDFGVDRLGICQGGTVKPQ